MKSIIAATTLATAAAVSQQGLEAVQRDGLSSDSTMGRQLLSQARRVEDGNNQYNQNDMSWVGGFSIKFTGCHTVTQWINEQNNNNDGNQADGNNAAYDPTNGKIEAVQLVRFRLCPRDSCFDHFGVGCSKHYGEYVVGLETFLQAYVAYEKEASETGCEAYRQTCYNKCDQSNKAMCWYNCYKGYGINSAMCNNYDENGQYYEGLMDMEQAIQCSAYDTGADAQVDEYGNEVVQHYLGPMCSGQGGTVTLGLFDDDGCQVKSDKTVAYYQKNYGAKYIPHTSESIISTNCLSCLAADEDAANGNADYYNYDADGNKNYYEANNVNSLCATAYLASGKIGRAHV